MNDNFINIGGQRVDLDVQMDTSEANLHGFYDISKASGAGAQKAIEDMTDEEFEQFTHSPEFNAIPNLD